MLKTMIKKELKRVFSDRRLVFSVFVLPPLMIFVIYTVMGSTMTDFIEDIDEHVASVHVYNAPEAFETLSEDFSEAFNVVFMEEPTDFGKDKEALEEGNLDLIIEFEDNFMEQVANYENSEVKPQVKTYYNPSEEYSNGARNNYINNVLNSFENKILEERFGNLNHVKAFLIDSDNNEAVVQDDKKAAGKGLGMIIPMLLTIFLFAGAMGVGLDTIAGEKERGTMATLLLTPVKRETIAIGKLISLGLISIMSALLSFGAIVASMPYASKMYTGGSDMDISSLSFDAIQYVQLLIIMITLVGVFVGLICVVSVRAKSMKEAGTYVSPIYAIVMIAAFSNMFSQGTPELTKFAIPIYSGVLSIKALLSFELTMSQFLITIAGNIIVTLILIVLISKSFQDEKIMLNA